MSTAPEHAQKKRLLVVVNVFHPDRGGGGAIFSDLCYGLAERGYDVTVRCAYPYYPEWKDKSGRNGLRIERCVEKGVHIERYGIYIPSKPRSLVQRLVYEASFFLSLLRALPRSRGFDLTMVYCPLVGAVAYAGCHKLVHGGPIWLNVQDLSADAAAASGIARGAAIKGLLSAVQKTLFNVGGIWSSISPVMLARLEPLRRRGQPLLYLPNWLNASMAEAIARQPAGKKRRADGPLRLLYAGNIGAKQDLPRFCEILRNSDAPFAFRIHGDGGLAGEMRAWVEASDDARFQFGPFLEEAAFARALHDADLFVITEKTGSGGSFIPCKTIAGISSGTPVLSVCDADSPLGREVHDYNLGPWHSWEEAAKAPETLRALAEDPGRLGEWRNNALDRARFYERGNVIEAFDNAIRTILDGNMPASWEG